MPISASVWAVPVKKLKDIEQSLANTKTKSHLLNEKELKLDKDLNQLRQRSISAASKARLHAARLTALEIKIGKLNRRSQNKKQALISRKKQLNYLIGAIQRIALHPPGALVALPSKPSDTVRTAILLRSILPEIEARAKNLKKQIDSLLDIRSAIIHSQEIIKLEQNHLDKERAIIAKLSSKKIKVMKSTYIARKNLDQKAMALSKQAKNLRELLASLTAKKNVNSRDGIASGVRNIPQKFVPLSRHGLPVVGQINVTFGQPDRSGERSLGLSIRARPGATVISPSKGKVVFAGPFKGLGNLLIIEFSDKIHILLGGLEKIFIPVGQKVLEGEPVGIISSLKIKDKILYFELRKNGQAINPLPWLALEQNRKRG